MLVHNNVVPVLQLIWGDVTSAGTSGRLAVVRLLARSPALDVPVSEQDT